MPIVLKTRREIELMRAAGKTDPRDDALKYIVSMGVVVPGGPSTLANK